MYISFTLKHLFENLLPLTTSLDRFMHVKVQDAQWSNLSDLSIILANEKLARANFEKTDHCVRLLIDLEV